jgi:acid phosphatase family membrane protein YuiD
MGNGIIFNNYILDTVFVSMFTAQFLKVIFSIFKEKKVNFRKFIETGSMPSSHTSSVVALTTCIGIKEGISSSMFALSTVFAIVTMYDATGVRRAAGKQAEVLNKVVESLQRRDGRKILEKKLKELLGHTPKEVLAGAVLGILIGYLMTKS